MRWRRCSNASTCKLLLGGRRSDAVKPQIHGLCSVVIRPAASQAESHSSTSDFLSERFGHFPKLGVIHFRKCLIAEIERSLCGCKQLILAVSFLGFFNFG